MTIDIKAFQEELETQTQNTQMFLPPGIHENVKLTNVIIKQTPVGVNVLEMTFEKDGKKTYYTEWLDEDKADDAKKKVVMGILQVLKAIVPKTILDSMTTVDTLGDFAEKTVLVLDKFKNEISLRLKTVYMKDKVTIPLHSRFPWIENMLETNSKIQILPRDMLTPPVAEMPQAA